MIAIALPAIIIAEMVHSPYTPHFKKHSDTLKYPIWGQQSVHNMNMNPEQQQKYECMARSPCMASISTHAITWTHLARLKHIRVLHMLVTLYPAKACLAEEPPSSVE